MLVKIGSMWKLFLGFYGFILCIIKRNWDGDWGRLVIFKFSWLWILFGGICYKYRYKFFYWRGWVRWILLRFERSCCKWCVVI